MEIQRVSTHNLPPSTGEPGIGFQKLLVAGNLGTCMGVNRSLVTAQIVLDMVDGREPVFVDHSLVHNNLVMDYFTERGLITEPDLRKIPAHGLVLRPAHGSTPESFDIARERELITVDTTCQLVTRVQKAAVEAEEDPNTTVIYRGTDVGVGKHHRETAGVLARLERAVYVRNAEEAANVEVPDTGKIIFLSQTTLSQYEIAKERAILEDRFGERLIIPKSSICYAATNRQDAVDQLLAEGIEALTVVGSHTSHNTEELYLKGVYADIPSAWIDEASDMDESWFAKEISTVGITAGASVVDDYINGVIKWYEDRGAQRINLPPVRIEHAGSFPLPTEDLAKVQGRYPERLDGSRVEIPKPQHAVFRLQLVS